MDFASSIHSNLKHNNISLTFVEIVMFHASENTK